MNCLIGETDQLISNDMLLCTAPNPSSTRDETPRSGILYCFEITYIRIQWNKVCCIIRLSDSIIAFVTLWYDNTISTAICGNALILSNGI